MKQCPKCEATIIDTAKFCPKCGVNIKKYEEENAKDQFCAECGAKLEDGDFCPECGARVNNTEASVGSADAFGDDWLSSINEMTAADIEREEARKREEEAAKREAEERERQRQIAEEAAKREAEEREKQRKAAEEAARQEAARQAQLRQAELIKRRNALFNQKFQREGNTIVFGRFPQSYAHWGADPRATNGYCTVNGKEYYRINTTREIQKTFRTIKEEIQKYYEIEPIRWIIIQESDESVLVVSEKILDYRIFREDEKATRKNDYINSDIRKWLNGEFLSKSFTSEEQRFIKPMTISNYYMDNIFLLSVDEYKKADRNNRQSTVYARDIYYNCGDWWLRTPEQSNASDEVKIVTEGYSYYDNLSSSKAISRRGVAPALRIDKTKLH